MPNISHNRGFIVFRFYDASFSFYWNSTVRKKNTVCEVKEKEVSVSLLCRQHSGHHRVMSSPQRAECCFCQWTSCKIQNKQQQKKWCRTKKFMFTWHKRYNMEHCTMLSFVPIPSDCDVLGWWDACQCWKANKTQHFWSCSFNNVNSSFSNKTGIFAWAAQYYLLLK